MAKSREAFRTISEVADWLGTQPHVLRFWESKFSQIKPVKRAGGRRYYRPADMALLGGIKQLLHEDGLTIKGVQKILKERGVKYVASLSEGVSAGDIAEAGDPPAPAPDDNVVSLKAARPRAGRGAKRDTATIEDATVVETAPDDQLGLPFDAPDMVDDTVPEPTADAVPDAETPVPEPVAEEPVTPAPSQDPVETPPAEQLTLEPSIFAGLKAALAEINMASDEDRATLKQALPKLRALRDRLSEDVRG